MNSEFRALALSFLGADFPMYIAKAPEGASLPCAVYFNVGASPNYCLSGDTRTAHARVQVDIYARTYREAESKAKILRNGMTAFRGGIFLGIFVESVRDGMEMVGAQEIHRVSTDFKINVKE